MGGCAAVAADSPEAEPSLGAVPVLESTAEIRLPLDAYQVTYDEWAAIALAGARLTRVCAARFGVDYDVAADHVLAGAMPPYYFDVDKNRHAYRYYLNDITTAREHGYQIPFGLPHSLVGGTYVDPAAEDVYTQVVLSGLEAGPVPPDLSGNSGRVETFPGAHPTDVERPVDSAGNTLPEGGCEGEAVTILAGDGDIHDFHYAINLGGSEAYFRALEDSRVVAVTREWSECMAGRGYDYGDPDEAGGDPTWLNADESRRPLPEEIVAAVADVECKQSLNYLGTRVAVETAYQELVIEEHFQDLERNYRNAQEMLRRANELTG